MNLLIEYQLSKCQSLHLSSHAIVRIQLYQLVEPLYNQLSNMHKILVTKQQTTFRYAIAIMQYFS